MKQIQVPVTPFILSEIQSERMSLLFEEMGLKLQGKIVSGPSSTLLRFADFLVDEWDPSGTDAEDPPYPRFRAVCRWESKVKAAAAEG